MISPDCPPDFIRDLLEGYEKEGYLMRKNSKSWRLTPDGVFWGNNLAVDFLQNIIHKTGAIYETV